MIFKNANVLLFEENGFAIKDIDVNRGKILRVEDKIDSMEQIVLDCSRMYITPGLIDAHSHIGMWEEGIGEDGADGNEYTNPIMPELRAIDGINPADMAFDEALQGGVTTVMTGPGSTNVVGGQFVTMKLHGEVLDDMIISEPAAMKCAFGENPKKYFGKAGKAPMTRMGIASMLRTTLKEANDYIERKNAAKGDVLKKPPFNEKLESFENVMSGEIPIKAHVHRADDILTAIRIAKEFDLKMTIDHCTEGHLITDKIKASGFPVILGPTFGFKSKVEVANKSFETAKILNDAGIKFAIMTDHPVHPQSSLIMWAALCVKAGLSEIEALKSVTINPAEILDIDHRVGSIKAGLDCDLVIWNKHPLDIQAKVMKTYVDGVLAYEDMSF